MVDRKREYPRLWVVSFIVTLAFIVMFIVVGLIVAWCGPACAETADVYDGSGNFAGQIVTDDGVVNTYDSAGDYTGQIVLPESGSDESNDD